jgi:hypothetical protein
MPRYVMSATDLGGGRPKERVTFDPPTPEQAAAFGDGYQAGYVSVRDEHGVVTLHGRDADGAWRVVAADVDAETAGELGLWFDLTQHGARRGDPDHPLGRAPEPPAAGRTTAEQAVALVVRLITARRLDYPVRGLAADRFAGGWSVYAPVEVDDSDPAAFLDMPVGRSVFLVGDTGRVKEVAGAVPPPQAEALFTAEEAYVRRGPEGELFLARSGTRWKGSAAAPEDRRASPPSRSTPPSRRSRRGRRRCSPRSPSSSPCSARPAGTPSPRPSPSR